MKDHKILFENKDFSIEIDDGIMVSRYKKDVIIDKNISSLSIKKRIELSNESNHYVLSDGSGVKYWTMSSRNNDMKEHAFKYIEKAAVVLPSSGVRFLWYLATKITPPPIPLKTFSTYENAKEWLLTEMHLKLNNKK